MKFWLRADASPAIGYGHALRMIGLAEQLLAERHEVQIDFNEDCPQEIMAKVPGAALIPWIGADAIEVVDSYNLKPVSGAAIEVGPRPWWFLREELLKARRRLRTGLKTLGISTGGPANEASFRHFSGHGVTILTPTFDSYGAFLDGCDVIAGAMGVSSWERAYFGIPSLGFLLADNQTENLMAHTRAMTTLCVGTEVGQPNQHALECWIELMHRNPDFVEFLSGKCLKFVERDSYSEFWDAVKGLMN